MSRSNPFVTDAIEMQQRTLETSKQALEEAVEFPLRQSVEFQRNAAKLLLNGLEMSSWAQNRGMEITRDTFSPYLDAVEDVAGQTAEMTEQGIEAAGQQALQSAQPMATGDGTQAPMTEQFQPAQKATWGAAEQPPQRGAAEQPPQRGDATQQTGLAPTPPATGQQSTPGQAMAPTQQSRRPRQPVAGSATPPQPARQAPLAGSPPRSAQQPAQSIQQPAQSIQQPAQSIQQPVQSVQQPDQSIQQSPQPARQPAQAPQSTAQTRPAAEEADAASQLPGTWSNGQVSRAARGPSRSEPAPPTDEGAPATGATRAESESNATEAAAENA